MWPVHREYVGFHKMMHVLFWCQLMGVREVTVYAFWQRAHYVTTS